MFSVPTSQFANNSFGDKFLGSAANKATFSSSGGGVLTYISGVNAVRDCSDCPISGGNPQAFYQLLATAITPVAGGPKVSDDTSTFGGGLHV